LKRRQKERTRKSPRELSRREKRFNSDDTFRGRNKTKENTTETPGRNLLPKKTGIHSSHGKGPIEKGPIPSDPRNINQRAAAGKGRREFVKAFCFYQKKTFGKLKERSPIRKNKIGLAVRSGYSGRKIISTA